MLPVIALVGRPNVGKSTLFNRLTKSRDALVADYSGLTRDRKYGEGRLGERDYIVVDTGGISGDEAGIDYKMAEQSLLAIEEADIVLFLVDGRAGLNPADEMIADHLRRSEKESYLIVNKTDGLDPEIAMADFHGLGLSEPLPIAASHGRGVTQLIEHVLAELPLREESEEDEERQRQKKIAIVGRPNVGKSTLVNRILGEDRVVVFDQAGTTRDSIYIPFERDDESYTLIDTAGIRRRKNVTEAVEKFSIIKTLRAINDANVVVLVIDAREGVSEQDLHLLGYVLDSGRSLVIAVNKWDGMSGDEKEVVREQLRRRLEFVSFARMHFISALHGSGVGNLFASVDEAYGFAMTKWATNKLTRLLEDIVADHQPPMVNGNRIKLRYAHQGGSNPPIIVIHGNQTSALPGSYKRYLENKFTKVLGIKGTPLRFEFKSSENPFKDKKNELTKRQVMKKLRQKLHNDKQKKKGKKR
ncbi:ribosome biogenesis GTPase Der [uncultured Amphritea sp.]|uniref:ribosome biogenesis GTPase Der n=1 Tax=Amphritea sp. TaxID=1872502 RepID=UPI001DA64534|nr:ribosome biogenesis GTPase Der [uncultured Amphritea sp.]MBR9866915.1 ribosome biogenesis GTPase Der [Oceanospirillales bacterium]MBR9886952.1 ribosome biogenesis GTPase Der [Oceanospirillales bacterium]